MGRDCHPRSSQASPGCPKPSQIIHTTSMSIWRTPATPEQLTERGSRGLAGHLGIRVTEVGPDFLRATMPVNERTHQPYGVLHGGASVALAETVGSMAA